MKSLYRFGLAATLLISAACSTTKNSSENTPDNPIIPEPEPEPYVVSDTLKQAFAAFVDEVNTSKLNIHQVTVYCHGELVGEEYFGTWTADMPHQLWSTTKTFTSLAVGFAIQDGLLSLDTKLSDIFPEETAKAAKNAVADRKDNLMNGTIEDYLIMACGHNQDATFKLMSQYGVSSSDLYVVTGYAEKNGRDLIADFFNFQFLRAPGSTFVYDSISSHVLSAAVQKVTGKKTVDYMNEKLFSKIGIEKPQWDEVLGVSDGGWGLWLNTRDMAKVGLALLNDKKYYDADIIPDDYLEKATAVHWDWSKSIPKTLSDIEKRAYNSGYGYQIWLNADSFYSKGMLGQYIYVLPKLDAVMAVTANLGDDDAPTRLLWKHLVPVFEKEVE